MLVPFIQNIAFPGLKYSSFVGCGHPLPSRHQPESQDFWLIFVLVGICLKSGTPGVVHFLLQCWCHLSKVLLFLASNIPCLWVVDIPGDGILPIICSQTLPSLESLVHPIIHSQTRPITCSQILPSSESMAHPIIHSLVHPITFPQTLPSTKSLDFWLPDLCNSPKTRGY